VVTTDPLGVRAEPSDTGLRESPAIGSRPTRWSTSTPAYSGPFPLSHRNERDEAKTPGTKMARLWDTGDVEHAVI
jgi:hypothetical protein